MHAARWSEIRRDVLAWNRGGRPEFPKAYPLAINGPRRISDLKELHSCDVHMLPRCAKYRSLRFRLTSSRAKLKKASFSPRTCVSGKAHSNRSARRHTGKNPPITLVSVPSLRYRTNVSQAAAPGPKPCPSSSSAPSASAAALAPRNRNESISPSPPPASQPFGLDIRLVSA
jgi:hypothetical protein